MKITSMRVNGKIPSTELAFEIEKTLSRRLARAGFITEVRALTRTSIKIGLWMRTFKIDRRIHDRNLRHNPHLGSRLTDSPTWEQRVEFNNIINRVLNKFKVSAKVKSGSFTIRLGRKNFTEDDWFDQKPEWMQHHECMGYYIESCDEQEFLEERRLERNRLARQRRRQAKIAKNRSAIALVVS